MLLAVEVARVYKDLVSGLVSTHSCHVEPVLHALVEVALPTHCRISLLGACNI